MSQSIRVLVVDDSPLIREIISDNIQAAPDMEVVGTAADGQEALSVFDCCRPDVVTLDIQMPKMDGLETLQALLSRRPVPVIMVSALTQLGANITLDALERGAVDYIAKPDGSRASHEVLGEDLLRKIRTVAGTDVEHVMAMRKARAERRQSRRATTSQGGGESRPRQPVPIDLSDKVIALGISTGGPPALASMLESLEAPLPPIVIVQHMPPHFTAAFARRLNDHSPLSVKEAASGDVLEPNSVYIAPGGKHLSIRRHPPGGRLLVHDGEPVSGHRPSVDVMMKSACEVYGANCLGVIMTGMGRDGANGCGAIRAAGGYVLGQDEESSDVYGMNKVAFLEGHVDRQFSLDDAAMTLMMQVRRQWGPATAGAR